MRGGLRSKHVLASRAPAPLVKSFLTLRSAAMASARQRTRLTTVVHPAESPMSALVPENRVQRTVTMTVTTAATTLPATPRRRRRARALVIARRDVGGAADAAVGGEAAAPVNGSPESVSLPNSLSRNNAWTIW